MTGDGLMFHPVTIFEEIDEETVKKAAVKTKGGWTPSRLDVDGWRKILTNINMFGNCIIDLRKALADFIRHFVFSKVEIKNSTD